ncbi:hypothetical protein COCSUDRAFT_83483 [Coccomyxa subellipsoidea C-169]|uniref:Gluconokinase n=1 Tax=Coccomyxa subellipsoidea (strain C-169) TaxID=574566 RepID=I0YUM3_COCSC|nr:hypothetical protein COCSUDRAFT_83483 [Coccomyxa subellipsoidea C-169]EIE22092.1 hypothetical protein COCSUDRAFT_83483 [Coccomyxa subellipsoidea C-169]|eukprot:XP_005646636.1 hypothetical protein COCSUDRAFT_83483 [Coccomyxa subellipsoidea C-169]
MQALSPQKSCIVVMGVSGCGKSSVGRCLAAHLHCTFLDADDYHPASNVEKMQASIPLTNQDRWPWLQALAHLIDQHLNSGEHIVMACSALKESYRDILRGRHPESVEFVLLKVSREKLSQRLQARQALRAHFMPAALLDSQLATLEDSGFGMTVVSGRMCPEFTSSTLLVSLGHNLSKLHSLEVILDFVQGRSQWSR